MQSPKRGVEYKYMKYFDILLGILQDLENNNCNPSLKELVSENDQQMMKITSDCGEKYIWLLSNNNTIFVRYGKTYLEAKIMAYDRDMADRGHPYIRIEQFIKIAKYVKDKSKDRLIKTKGLDIPVFASNYPEVSPIFIPCKLAGSCALVLQQTIPFDFTNEEIRAIQQIISENEMAEVTPKVKQALEYIFNIEIDEKYLKYSEC